MGRNPKPPAGRAETETANDADSKSSLIYMALGGAAPLSTFAKGWVGLIVSGLVLASMPGLGLRYRYQVLPAAVVHWEAAALGSAWACLICARLGEARSATVMFAAALVGVVSALIATIRYRSQIDLGSPLDFLSTLVGFTMAIAFWIHAG